MSNEQATRDQEGVARGRVRNHTPLTYGVVTSSLIGGFSMVPDIVRQSSSTGLHKVLNT